MGQYVGWVLLQYEWGSYKKRKKQIHRMGRPCDNGGRDWRDAAASPGTSKGNDHHELGRGKGGFSPTGFRGSRDAVTS